MVGRRVFVGALLATALCPRAAFAAAEVPPMQQTLLAFRVLAYDRNLKSRAGGDVATIAILFKQGDKKSEQTRDDVADAMIEAAKSTEIGGLAVKVVRVAYKSAAEFEKIATSQRLAAAYVCTGLHSEVAGISKTARANHILTLTPSEGYVDSGLGIGIIKRGAKPTVLVNLPATRAEGTDLDAALLSLAEVKR